MMDVILCPKSSHVGSKDRRNIGAGDVASWAARFSAVLFGQEKILPPWEKESRGKLPSGYLT